MYEAVHARPVGDATAARFAHTAARYGFEGIVVRGHGPDASPDGPDHAERAREAAVDVVDAVEVVADDPSAAAGAVGNYRPDHTLVLVRGGTDALNRFAVEQGRVDVLTAPLSGDGDADHVLVRTAREHGVAVEFDLGPVLRDRGGSRVRAIRKLRKLRELVEQYDAPFVVSAGARSHLQLRAPRELRAVGDAVGLDGGTVETGLREWGRLAARNRERASPSFVEPGVRRGRADEPADGDGRTGGDGGEKS